MHVGTFHRLNTVTLVFLFGCCGPSRERTNNHTCSIKEPAD